MVARFRGCDSRFGQNAKIFILNGPWYLPEAGRVAGLRERAGGASALRPALIGWLVLSMASAHKVTVPVRADAQVAVPEPDVEVDVGVPVRAAVVQLALRAVERR